VKSIPTMRLEDSSPAFARAAVTCVRFTSLFDNNNVYFLSGVPKQLILVEILNDLFYLHENL
jgi:hypothetical protein